MIKLWVSRKDGKNRILTNELHLYIAPLLKIDMALQVQGDYLTS